MRLAEASTGNVTSVVAPPSLMIAAATREVAATVPIIKAVQNGLRDGKGPCCQQSEISFPVGDPIIELIFLSGLTTAPVLCPAYSTVTDLARLRGWSTSVPRSTATW